MTSFEFRPLAEEDLPTLHAWLALPHVAEWWGPVPSLDELRAHYLPAFAGPSDVRPFMALLGGRASGFIQSYRASLAGNGWWEDETDPGVVGIDQFFADAKQLGKGHGTEMVRSFLAFLFADPTVTRVQADPHPGNARAIRCYEKAGFVRVDEVDTPDGPALLMTCERAAVDPEDDS